MSKKILVLGAGLVSQPLIDYLFTSTSHKLVVADIQLENAEKAIAGQDRGHATLLDVNDEGALKTLIFMIWKLN